MGGLGRDFGVWEKHGWMDGLLAFLGVGARVEGKYGWVDGWMDGVIDTLG